MKDELTSKGVDQLVEAKPSTPLEAPRDRVSCRLDEIWVESGRYVGLRVAVGQELREAYQMPGQYVTLTPPNFEARFLVIANAPGVPSREGWEFLIDRRTELGTAVEELTAGDTVDLSPPEGPGYPADDVRHHDVLCFTTGSGIASIRPAVQFWEERPELAPESVTIYYGESHPGDFAYREEARDWTYRDIRVFHCHEVPGETSDGFRYVQQAFDSHDPSLEDAVVFISGASVMKEIVIDELLTRGIPLEHIVTNIDLDRC